MQIKSFVQCSPTYNVYCMQNYLAIKTLGKMDTCKEQETAAARIPFHDFYENLFTNDTTVVYIQFWSDDNINERKTGLSH